MNHTTSTGKRISIEQIHRYTFKVSAELKTGSLFSVKYIDHTKAEAIRLFKAAYKKENDKYFINQPNI